MNPSLHLKRPRHRSIPRSVVLAVGLALVLLASACSDSSSGDGGGSGDGTAEPTDGTDTTGAAASPLGRWVSTHVLEDGAPAEGFEGVTVNVDIEEDDEKAGVIRVRAACNTFGTHVEITDDQLVSDGTVGTTEMGCDPVRHAQDQWLTELLLASPSWSLDDDVLTLSADGRELRLVDHGSASVPAPFAGTRWVLDTIVTGEVASSVPAGVEAWFAFADDGSFTGFDGCGSVSGTYLLEAGRLRFGAATATDANCGGPSEPVEAAITNAIGHAHEVTIEGQVLTLRDGEDGELVWRAG